MSAHRLTQVFALTAESRQRVLGKFRPCHPNVHAYRVYHCRGVEAGRPLPPSPREVTVTGFYSDDSGFEYLSVSVDGVKQNAEGKPYLLVLSLAGGKSLEDCQEHFETEGAFPAEGLSIVVEPQYYHEEVEES